MTDTSFYFTIPSIQFCLKPLSQAILSQLRYTGLHPTQRAFVSLNSCLEQASNSSWPPPFCGRCCVRNASLCQLELKTCVFCPPHPISPLLSFQRCKTRQCYLTYSPIKLLRANLIFISHVFLSHLPISLHLNCLGQEFVELCRNEIGKLRKGIPFMVHTCTFFSACFTLGYEKQNGDTA